MNATAFSAMTWCNVVGQSQHSEEHTVSTLRTKEISIAAFWDMKVK